MDAYELLGAIGQGQYGTAYRARHKSDNKLCCIKRIAMNSREDVNDGLREAQLLSSLDHPNIIGYKESFVDRDSLCIVTTFCEEGDLFKKIRKRAVAKQYFTENEVMDMFMQIANGMMHIHARKILHRDLKTQNIFMGKGGVIKLGDFGISKVLEKTDQFATTVTGTPYYMAPEICTNQPYTFKSDIWSLGCVLYELCTLQHAFAADSLLSLVYQIVRGNYPPIPTDIFSQDLAGLIHCMLQRDPAQRPSLQQIFGMPYVAHHMERFKREEQRRLVHQRSSINHSRSNNGRLDKYALEAAELYSPHSQATASSDDEALTPKQRMQKRKEEENMKRNLELQVANINRRQDLVGVAKSKQKMHESTVFESGMMKGAGDNMSGRSNGQIVQPYKGPGAPPLSVQQPSFSSWEYGARAGADPGSSQQPHRRSFSGDEEDSVLVGTVTGGSTVPSGLRGPSPAMSISLQGGNGGGFRFGYDSDLSPSSAQSGSQYGGAMGPNPPSSKGSSVASGGFKFGIDPGDRSPVCSQELFAQQANAVPSFAPGVVKFGVSTDTTPRNSFNYIMPSARVEEEPQRPAAPGMTPGGKITFGVSTDTTPRSSFNFVPSPSNFGPNPSTYAPNSANPSPYAPNPANPSPYAPNPANPSPYAPNSANSSPYAPNPANSSPYAPNPANSSAYTPNSTIPSTQQPFAVQRSHPDLKALRPPELAATSYNYNAYEQHHEMDDDDEYIDDFEDYEEDFEEYEEEELGGEQVAAYKERVQGLQSLTELQRSLGNGHPASFPSVQDQSSTLTKEAKQAALRGKCLSALGCYFSEVYDYLRDVRTSKEYVDERDVQATLLDIVDGDRQLLQGCFLCDQLVFQETMYR